jgi:hypothetical protein
MEIDIRRASKYKDVTIVQGNTVISMGLLDDQECLELAKSFKQAIYELLESEEYERVMAD